MKDSQILEEPYSRVGREWVNGSSGTASFRKVCNFSSAFFNTYVCSRTCVYSLYTSCAPLSSSAMLSVVIVGGGLGGFSTAIGLALSGHRVTLLESQKQFSEASVVPRRISKRNHWMVKSNMPLTCYEAWSGRSTFAKPHAYFARLVSFGPGSCQSHST